MNKNAPLTRPLFHFPPLVLPAGLARALLISQVMAFVWWGAAMVVSAADVIPVWYDQRMTFTQVGLNLSQPYVTHAFNNPVWAAALLFPFSLLSIELAVLAQLCLYFAILTGIIYKM